MISRCRNCKTFTRWGPICWECSRLVLGTFAVTIVTALTERWIEMLKRLLPVLLLVTLAACGATLPPITVVIPVPKPVEPKPVEPTPTPTPEPQPEPVPEPTPEPPPLLPLENLNIVVHDAAGVGIAGASCVVAGEERRADGAGFINFAVRGSNVVGCTASGYVARMADLPPGNHRFALVSIEKPKPPTPPVPDPVTPTSACGKEGNTGRISRECLDAVAATSEHWASCEKGDAEDCSLYVWEVARALGAAQKTKRWGLISKPSGSNFRGYGEDVVAYLPERFTIDDKTWQWNGADIIGGLGGPTPSKVAGKLHGAIACGTPEAEAERWCNRSDNFWAQVPPK